MHISIELLSNVCMEKCLSLIAKIINDQSNPMHQCISVLPHGHLQTVKCRTEQFCKTFLPVAIKLYLQFTNFFLLDIAHCQQLWLSNALFYNFKYCKRIVYVCLW